MQQTKPVMSPKEFGELLFSKRKERQMTQPEVAKLLGVTKGAINHWEKGRVGSIKPENLMALANLYGLKGLELIEQLARALNTTVDANDYSDIPRHRLDLIRTYGNLPADVRRPIRQLIETLALTYNENYLKYEKKLRDTSEKIKKEHRATRKPDRHVDR